VFFFIFLLCTALATLGWRHINPVFAVGCEHAVEPGHVDSRFRHQGSQLGIEIQRFEYHVRGTIAAGKVARTDNAV
jgi:hypothetical protein